jgi:hypothetical protein
VKSVERREFFRAELVDLLGRGQILQPVLAQVMKISALGERSRRGRDEHLAAVAARCDPGRAVDVRADVALRGDVRSSRVQAHAHTDRAGLQSTQSLGRRF